MTKKIFVKYTGNGPAVLAGEFIQPGETREVFPYQVVEAQRHHPDAFAIVGAQTGNAQEQRIPFNAQGQRIPFNAQEQTMHTERSVPAGKPKGEKAPKAERKQPAAQPPAEQPNAEAPLAGEPKE